MPWGSHSDAVSPSVSRVSITTAAERGIFTAPRIPSASDALTTLPTARLPDIVARWITGAEMSV